MNIEKLLEELELESVENGYQENIELWQQYYGGNVVGFHDYQEFNGYTMADRERLTLNMAKTICQKWADNSYNPETEITVGETYEERLHFILDYNDFETKLNREIEKGYALGTMGIVTTLINDIPNIQFVSADMMYPVYDDNRFGWAIISEYQPNVYYVSVHYEQLKGVHRVDNYIVKVDKDKYTVLSDEELKSDYGINSSDDYREPMLQVFKPAIANNIDYTTPYGLSVFANAIDELKAVDTAFTLTNTEIETGKRRLFTMVENLQMLSDGHVRFDSKLESLYIQEGQQTFSDGTTVKTDTPTLRSDHILNTLKVQLGLLGNKVGLGQEAFKFEDGQVYTNTAQVVSTNSEFYKTRQKMLRELESVIVRMVRAIYYLDTGKEYQDEVDVHFDDSIIHDKEREDKELDFQLMNGLVSEVYYWQVKKGLSEELAIEFVNNQKELKGLKELPDEEGGEE